MPLEIYTAAIIIAFISIAAFAGYHFGIDLSARKCRKHKEAEETARVYARRQRELRIREEGYHKDTCFLADSERQALQSQIAYFKELIKLQDCSIQAMQARWDTRDYVEKNQEK